MFFKIIKPSKILENYVKQYWALEMDGNAGNPGCHRVIPHGLVEIVFNYKDLYQCVTQNGIIKQPRVAVSGQKNRFFDVVPAPKTGMISVMLHPHRANCFFDFPISDIYNQSVDFEDIFKGKANYICERIVDAGNFSDKIRIVEEFLIGQLKKSSSKTNDCVKHSIQLINIAKGQVSTGEITKKLNLGNRQFERVFKSDVGISPKQFMRIIRFQSVLFDIQNNPGQDLTTLGLNNGYYDQSHFVKEFKEFSGYGPKDYFKSAPVYSDYFN